MGISSSRWLGHRSVVLAIVTLVALASSLHSALAAPPEEIGPEFTVFHSESGGVHVFGYALSPRVIEDGRVAQYFERQRFEHHEENAYPYEVLLGRLGSEEARERGLSGSSAFVRVGDADRDSSCLYFEKTGHQVCGRFKSHWESHGLNLGDSGVSHRESVALFGYPISREFTDPDTGLTTQYFERARFEYHEEHRGTPYEVLLGRLGSPLWKSRHQFAELAPAVEIGTATGTFAWPAEGKLTQHFGHTSFAQSSGGYGADGHTGIDIANSVNTPIRAADGGTVVEAGWMGGYGYAVVIDHGNGYETLYGHMAQQPAVSVGQRVERGEYIGPMGSTGFSTGSHLHFEVIKDGTFQDPLQYLD